MSREGGEVIVADAVKFVPSALKMMTGHEMAAAEEIRIDNHLGRGTLSSFSRLELKSRCDNVHMAWIETIPESEAQGDLRLSYEAAVKRAGRVWKRESHRPAGGDFQGIRVYRSDGAGRARKVTSAPVIIVSNPPGYPSAGLLPSRARFRFTRQRHCNSIGRCLLTA